MPVYRGDSSGHSAGLPSPGAVATLRAAERAAERAAFRPPAVKAAPSAVKAEPPAATPQPPSPTVRVVYSRAKRVSAPAPAAKVGSDGSGAMSEAEEELARLQRLRTALRVTPAPMREKLLTPEILARVSQGSTDREIGLLVSYVSPAAAAAATAKAPSSKALLEAAAVGADAERGECAAPPSPVSIETPIDISASQKSKASPRRSTASAGSAFFLLKLTAGLAAGLTALVAGGGASALAFSLPPPPPACHFDGLSGCVPSNDATKSCDFRPRFAPLDELCLGVA